MRHGASPNKETDYKTYFKAGYDAESVYLFIVCEEPRVGSIKATADNMEDIWNDDSIEVFLSPGRDRSFFQFMVNAEGNRWSGTEEGADRGLLAGWHAETDTREGYWTAELKIPWEVLAKVPRPGDRWGFNIGRNRMVDGRESSSWADVLRSFRDPENFGALEFTPNVPTELLARLEKRREQFSKPDKKPSEEMFVFSRMLSGTFVMRDGSLERLLYNQGPYLKPEFAPGIDRFLFNSQSGGEKGIWIKSISGGGRERICAGEHGSWSPDGKNIVFSRNGTVIERNLSSGEENLVSPEDWSECIYPSYGPGGEIYFVYSGNLYLASEEILRLAGGDIRGPARICNCGRRLAYRDGAHIYLMETEVNRKTRLTLLPGTQAHPVWSAECDGITFLQKHDPHAQEGDLFHMFEGGSTAGLIERNVYPGFDWKGSAPAVMGKVDIRGRRVLLWEGKDIKHGEVFSKLTKEGYAVEGEVETEGEVILAGHEMGSLHISRADGRLRYLFGDWDSPASVEIVFKNRWGTGLRSIDTVRAGETSEGAIVRISGEAEGGGRVEAEMEIYLGMGFVVFNACSEVDSIAIEANLEHMVLPDRLGSDMLFDLNGTREGILSLLGGGDLVLGLTGRGSGILLLMPGGDNTGEIELAEKGKVFIKQKFTDEPFAMGAVHGERVWEEIDLQKNQSGVWETTWKAPYHGRWRLAARDKEGLGYSIMMGEEFLQGSGGTTVGLEELRMDDVSRAVVYMFGRSLNSPYIVTPKDAVLTYKGRDGANRFLNTDRARGYYAPEQWFPALVLGNPVKKTQDFENVFSVFSGRGIHRRQLDCVRVFVSNILRDVIVCLQSLDERIEQYESFGKELEKLTRDSDGGYTPGLAGFITQELKALGNSSPIPIEDIEEIAERMVSDYGRDEADFKDTSMEALNQRREILLSWAEFARKLREMAKKEAVTCRESDAPVIELIKKTSRVLDGRNYFEKGWRGEEPVLLEPKR